MLGSLSGDHAIDRRQRELMQLILAGRIAFAGAASIWGTFFLYNYPSRHPAWRWTFNNTAVE